ncbi:hypothetical protein F5Y05DRAFT_377620 [Hypoxylon sp. FL0543]|nr:hypothetical protein F5Y05DRAFT_377620 [Hypoxylon sp. FL0543]
MYSTVHKVALVGSVCPRARAATLNRTVPIDRFSLHLGEPGYRVNRVPADPGPWIAPRYQFLMPVLKREDAAFAAPTLNISKCPEPNLNCLTPHIVHSTYVVRRVLESSHWIESNQRPPRPLHMCKRVGIQLRHLASRLEPRRVGGTTIASFSPSNASPGVPQKANGAHIPTEQLLLSELLYVLRG